MQGPASKTNRQFIYSTAHYTLVSTKKVKPPPKFVRLGKCSGLKTFKS